MLFKQYFVLPKGLDNAWAWALKPSEERVPQLAQRTSLIYRLITSR
jgi:hypothetical protein